MKLLTYYPPTHWRPEKATAINELKQAIKSGQYATVEVPCANCHADQPSALFSCDRYGLPWHTAVCKRCGLVYSSPRFTPDSNATFYASDQYRQIYGETGDLQGRYNTDWPYNDFAGRFLDFVETVLEIGAGGGWNLLPLAFRGKVCVGYDYSPAFVETGRGRGLDLRQGDDADVEGQHDLIMLIHTLEHWLSPVAQLSHLRARLNQGGYLLIEVPGFNDRVPSIQSAHTFYFSTGTLRSILEQAGYRIIKTEILPQNGYIRALAQAHVIKPPFIDPFEYPRIRAIVRRFRVTAAKYFIKHSCSWRKGK